MNCISSDEEDLSRNTVLVICAPARHILLSSHGVVTACFMTTKCDVLTREYIANCSLVVVHSQKRASCGKSAIVKPISGCVSHSLLRLDDNKSVTSC